MSQDLVTFKLYSKHTEPVDPSDVLQVRVSVSRGVISTINLFLHFGATSCSQLCSGTQQSDDLVSGETPPVASSLFSPGALQTCQVRPASPRLPVVRLPAKTYTAASRLNQNKNIISVPSICVGEHAGNWSTDTASTVRVTVAQSIKLNLLDGKPFNCLFISVVAPSSVPTLTQLCKVHREKLYSSLFNLMTSSHEAATRIWNVTDQDWSIENSGHCLQPQAYPNTVEIF